MQSSSTTTEGSQGLPCVPKSAKEREDQVSFLDLPAELRNKIYEHYADTNTAHVCSDESVRGAWSLRRVSKQVRHELRNFHATVWTVSVFNFDFKAVSRILRRITQTRPPHPAARMIIDMHFDNRTTIACIQDYPLQIRCWRDYAYYHHGGRPSSGFTYVAHGNSLQTMALCYKLLTITPLMPVYFRESEYQEISRESEYQKIFKAVEENLKAYAMYELRPSGPALLEYALSR